MEIQTKTASGIIIEGMKNRDPFAVGTIVSVGEGYALLNGDFQVPPVKKGDTVFYDKGKVAIMNGLVYINSDHIMILGCCSVFRPRSTSTISVLYFLCGTLCC